VKRPDPYLAISSAVCPKYRLFVIRLAPHLTEPLLQGSRRYNRTGRFRNRKL